MFHIDEQYSAENLLVFYQIIGKKKILLSDEEPLLFSGQNKFGNFILTSFVENINDTTRYFSTLINTNIYSNFLNKKITYLSILEENNIFVYDQDFDEEIKKCFSIDISLIPKDYLPSSNSYCPTYNIKPSFAYSISLDGLRSSLSELKPKVAAKSQIAFAEFIENVINKLIKGLSTEAISLPSSAGSYKFNYRIESKASENYLIKELDSKLPEIINLVISQNLSELESYIDNFKELDNNLKFQNLRKSLINLGLSNLQKPDYRENIINTYISSYKKLEDLGDFSEEEFNEIIVSNSYNSNATDVILTINRIELAKIPTILDKYERLSGEFEFVDIYEKMEGVVYDINIESRKGYAIVIFNGKQSRPRFFIEGEKHLIHSPFTNSLDSGESIKFKAKYKFKGDRIHYLWITY